MMCLLMNQKQQLVVLHHCHFFVKEFDGFDLKPKVSKEKPVVRESIDDEIKELEETEILGDDEVPRDDKAGGGLSYLMGV